MKKVGIVTYHSAYNYGSVLQAYATQEVLRNLGYIPTIINYRLAEQKKIYALYRTRYGVKTLLKDLSMLPDHKQRRVRTERFEEFISGNMILSERFFEPEDFVKTANAFPVVVSGSDQIWNKHSLELEHIDWRYMNPYILRGYNGKKISYASSIANMSEDNLNMIMNDLLAFSHISLRECESSVALSQFLGRKTETVLDPTLLFNYEGWSQRIPIEDTDERYVLFYSLAIGYQSIERYINALQKYALKHKLKIKIINPYVHIRKSNVELCASAGPVEFLNLIKNAHTIVTDSYHGTAFSLNFGKNFYSLVNKGGAEFRKTSLLKIVGCEHRIISDIEDINSKVPVEIDQTFAQSRITEKRKQSIEYLRSAIEG